MAQKTLGFPKTSDKSLDSPIQLGLNLRPSFFLALAGILLVLFALSLLLGSVSIPLDEIVRVLFGGSASKESWETIILKFRLPKAITAMLAGSALGISGLMMQTFFRNPLAGPDVLGISSGASLGVAIVVLSIGTAGGTILAGVGLLGDLGLVLASSIGAGLVLILVLFVARNFRSNMTLLILGLMFSYLTSALVSLLIYFSIPEQIQAYLNWTFGSFSGVTTSQLLIFAPITLFGIGIAFFLPKSLNALLLGEQYAQSMGVNLPKIRIWVITSTALLAGTVTAFCGPIGFVGVAVPHLCRGLFRTSDHRILAPACTLIGAIVALVASLIAEVPMSHLVLPLNAVTSLIGAPVLIWVIVRQQHLQRSFAP